MTAKHPKKKDRPGVDVYGRTPLHQAAADGNAALCNELLSSGSDPNVQDDNGWSPLHFAAQASSPEVTELLLQASANTALRDSHGNTALSKAVFSSKGKGIVITLLRNAGADPLAINNSGVSPLILARSISNFNVSQFFSDLP